MDNNLGGISARLGKTALFLICVFIIPYIIGYFAHNYCCGSTPGVEPIGICIFITYMYGILSSICLIAIGFFLFIFLKWIITGEGI